ncbi:MAG TPA: hypothetical protein VIP46_15000 [Pyrinomonadaceae bacterium]
MKRPVHAARLLNRRALVVVGALLVLCVSDNVGPRLLPLPPLPELVSTPKPADQRRVASRAPSQSRTTGARVEIVSAPQGRAASERQSPQAAAHAPKFALAAPLAPTSPSLEPYQPSGERSAPFSRPKGRAPPRLV